MPDIRNNPDIVAERQHFSNFEPIDDQKSVLDCNIKDNVSCIAPDNNTFEVDMLSDRNSHDYSRSIAPVGDPNYLTHFEHLLYLRG